MVPPTLPQVFLLHLFPVAIDQISSREIITWHHYHSQHFYVLPLVSSLHCLIKFREGSIRGKKEYLLKPDPINRSWRSCFDWGTLRAPVWMLSNGTTPFLSKFKIQKYPSGSNESHAKYQLLMEPSYSSRSRSTFISNGNELSMLLTVQDVCYNCI